MSLRAIVSAVAIPMLIVCGLTVTSALAQDAAVVAEVDRTMEDYRLNTHIPAWCGASSGRRGWCCVKGDSVQDIDTKHPVTPDTLSGSRR